MSGNLFKPATDRLTNRRPKEIIREPAYEGTSQRYGFIKLGTRANNTYHFVFDLVNGPHPRFYFDANGNGDLTDDHGPLANQGTGVFSTQIELPLNRIISQMTQPGDFLMWFFTNQDQWNKGLASHYSRTQMKGHIKLGGKTYPAFIMEQGVNDGDFTNDGIFIDLDENGKIDRKKEWVPPGKKAKIGNKEYPIEIYW